MKLLMCAAAVLTALTAAFYIGGSARNGVPVSDGSLKKVNSAGRFVLGIDVDFPPMSFIDEKGEIVGFDIDMAKEFCRRIGVELVLRPINWDTKEEELDGGTIDCIGSMSVTPESIRDMNLSEPYVKENLIFVVPGGSDAKWLDDLKGMRIGVQSGSTTQEALDASDIRDDVTAVPFDDNLAILRQLKDGKLDAGLVDSLAAYYFIYSSNERYFVLSESLGEEKLAIGFRKNDKELRDMFQEIISSMKADG